ncbi:MAG: hypothetical protein ACXABD_14560 [Candidatus Thorarchaeota archaeon]|jgi:hypothetical protein
MATDHAGAWNDVFPEWDYRFQEDGVPIVNQGTGGQNLGAAGAPTFRSGGLGGGPTSTTYAVSMTTTGDIFEYDASTSIPTYTATEGAIGMIFKGPTADGTDKEMFEILNNTSPFPRVQLKKNRTGSSNPNYDNMPFFRLSDGVNGNWWWTLDWTDPLFVDIFDDQWHILVLRQKADGATGMEFWIDGVNVPSTTIAETDPSYGINTWLSDIFSASFAHQYTVGNSSTGTAWDGEIAGWGITDTAPSDAQILQMAEDFELFDASAKFRVKTARTSTRNMLYDFT